MRTETVTQALTAHLAQSRERRRAQWLVVDDETVLARCDDQRTALDELRLLLRGDVRRAVDLRVLRLADGVLERCWPTSESVGERAGRLLERVRVVEQRPSFVSPVPAEVLAEWSEELFLRLRPVHFELGFDRPWCAAIEWPTPDGPLAAYGYLVRAEDGSMRLLLDSDRAAIPRAAVYERVLDGVRAALGRAPSEAQLHALVAGEQTDVSAGQRCVARFALGIAWRLGALPGSLAFWVDD